MIGNLNKCIDGITDRDIATWSARLPALVHAVLEHRHADDEHDD